MAVTVTPLKGEKVLRFAKLHDAEEQEKLPKARFGERGCVLNARYESSAQEVKDFPVREDDVWVVTPPKCGTTWTQEMVWLLMNDLDYDGAKEKKLLMRFPYMEFSRIVSERFLKNHLNDLDTLKCAGSATSPRCIKSHLPKDLLPVGLWTKKPKIIYVAREPKDVAVSFFYHHQLLISYKGDKEFFFECFYEDLVINCPLWEHILDFWKMKNEPNILFNTFEEMKENLPAVIRRTAKFLEKEITDEQVERLATHLDFKQMKKNPSVNFEDTVAKIREKGLIGEDQAFIRKGVVGEGRREMSAEMRARYDERTRSVFSDAVGGSPWRL